MMQDCLRIQMMQDCLVQMMQDCLVQMMQDCLVQMMQDELMSKRNSSISLTLRHHDIAYDDIMTSHMIGLFGMSIY